jgi:hypothetical protein
VTDCPTVEGFAEELNVVIEDAWLTVWVSGDDVDPV